MNNNKLMPIAALVTLPIVIIGSLLAIPLLFSPSSASNLSGAAIEIDLSKVPAGPIAGYKGVQLKNAAIILKAGKDLGLDARDQIIGIMTAMGESSLMVLDHGDAAGPDSRGLFQQRAGGKWGSYADRMNPYISATNFYRALMQIPERDGIEPTLLAHQVQRNQNPFHYAPYWDPAVAVVEGLARAGTAQPVAYKDGERAPEGQGWTQPVAGELSSPFGPRTSPVSGAAAFHRGIDLAAPAGTPIYAASAGIVIYAGPSSGFGNLIEIEHGDGVMTRYGHMFGDGLLVSAGDTVKAGQVIGLVGSAGESTGYHLHFEVMIDGQNVDPLAFLHEKGIDY